MQERQKKKQKKLMVIKWNSRHTRTTEEGMKDQRRKNVMRKGGTNGREYDNKLVAEQQNRNGEIMEAWI